MLALVDLDPADRSFICLSSPPSVRWTTRKAPGSRPAFDQEAVRVLQLQEVEPRNVDTNTRNVSPAEGSGSSRAPVVTTGCVSCSRQLTLTICGYYTIVLVITCFQL